MPSPRPGLKLNFHDYKEFGKFMMNIKLLLNENILLIKYPKSFAPIPKLRRTKISDTLKDVLITLFETNEINYQLLKQCSKSEKEIFNFLMEKSNLKFQLNYDKSKLDYTEAELIDRFNIVKGIIEAGNDNKELLTEAQELITKLKELKKIDENVADEILTELKIYIQ